MANTNKNTERLDELSKILVATSAINYMANTLYILNHQNKIVRHQHKMNELNGVISNIDTSLNNAINKLKDAMEDLGGCINSIDATTPIDIRVTKEAFEIISHGNDLVEFN